MLDGRLGAVAGWQVDGKGDIRARLISQVHQGAYCSVLRLYMSLDVSSDRTSIGVVTGYDLSILNCFNCFLVYVDW